MSRSTQQRNHVTEIAKDKPNEALKTARDIEDPWFRCQALTVVALHCADMAQKNRLLDEAFEAALLTEQPNRIVSVSAWPLKVLCLSGQDVKLNKEVERLLTIIAREPSPVKCSDALNEMLGALISAPRPPFWRVFEFFHAACTKRLLNGKRNAKGQSRLAHWILVTDRFDTIQTQKLLEDIEGPALRAQAESNLQQYQNLSPEQWCGWPNLR